MHMPGINIGLGFYVIFVNLLVRVLSANVYIPYRLRGRLTLLTNQMVKLLDCVKFN